MQIRSAFRMFFVRWVLFATGLMSGLPAAAQCLAVKHRDLGCDTCVQCWRSDVQRSLGLVDDGSKPRSVDRGIGAGGEHISDFFACLPAGAFAEISDKHKYLIVVEALQLDHYSIYFTSISWAHTRALARRIQPHDRVELRLRMKPEPGCKLHDLGRDFFLAKLPFSLHQSGKRRLSIVLGGNHRDHPRVVLGDEGMHGRLAELRINVFGRQPLKQQLRRDAISGACRCTGRAKRPNSIGSREWRSIRILP